MNKQYIKLQNDTSANKRAIFYRKESLNFVRIKLQYPNRHPFNDRLISFRLSLRISLLLGVRGSIALTIVALLLLLYDFQQLLSLLNHGLHLDLGRTIFDFYWIISLNSYWLAFGIAFLDQLYLASCLLFHKTKDHLR